MFGLGATELVIILVVALVIFGPGKLPELGGALGKGIRDFRKSLEAKEEPPQEKIAEESRPQGS
jgi:sec-independent protein translocase protein TatA